MERVFDRIQADREQTRFCRENHLPRFVPEQGYCFCCGNNVFDAVQRFTGSVRGISVSEAGTELIASCPHCSANFCY